MRKTLICLFLASASLQADEDTFREKFADPATRFGALSELIPGSAEAYFHTALAHQLAGHEEEFKKTMADWKAASGRKNSAIGTTGMEVLENRQLLIGYPKNPDASLAALIRRLNLKFDDARPDAAAAAENLPTRIDPKLLSEDAFFKTASELTDSKPYLKFSTERLARELDQAAAFDEAELRWFMENLDRADLPGVVTMLDRALRLDPPMAFDSFKSYDQLTSDQLVKLLELHPELRSDETFDLEYLQRLLPGAETDFARDHKAHAAHLQHCRDFAIGLPPALNSLKAHVLYHHLRLQSELGNYPKADFIAFLQLPREKHELLLASKSEEADYADLSSDYSEATACPSIDDDAPLIQDYLQHFLSETDSAKDFEHLIVKSRLAQIHARARLLAGADADRWSKQIPPADFKPLLDETQLTFAASTPKRFDADAAAVLIVDLKNTPDLMVRIYELDLPSYLSRHESEPDVSVDLEGLVPHAERHVMFEQAPIRLHRENIALPELAGGGAWIVELVSGNVSARALIRKGELIPFIEQTASGQTIRVFDEKGNQVRSAIAKLGSETISADNLGRIIIPDSANQSTASGMIQSGKLAANISLKPRADELALNASFHLEREQLLAEKEARLHLRISLTNHGHELPLDRIKDPALVLKAGLIGGITTERVIAENLKLSPLLEIPFQVPADLLSLTLTLRGTVEPPAGGEPVKLSQNASYAINGDLKTSQIAAAFFSPTAEGHRLEIRGRNGEPMPSRAVTLECTHAGFTSPITLQLRTDASGRIDLGTLENIDRIEASGGDISRTSYEPAHRRFDYPSTLQISSGTDIRLPLEFASTKPDRARLSLLEFVNEKPVRDHFDKIIIEDGLLIIKALPPGDFVLTQNGRATQIAVSSGVAKDGLLISKTRIMPAIAPPVPVIGSAVLTGDEIDIRLRNFGPATRLTLIGKRYVHGDWFSGNAIRPFPPTVSGNLEPGFTECGFLTDRNLSDEMRYILDRRSIKSIAGSMLPRAGLLLNRWTDQDLKQDKITGNEGTDGKAEVAGGSSGIQKRQVEGNFEKTGASELPAICDFFAAPAIVRFDLQPAADGSLKIPLVEFKGSQYVEIVATDVSSSDSLRLPLPANDTPLRDRRIARPLDPQMHHLATRSAAVLAKGAQASIENLLDAEWRAFTTLTDAHQLLYGMTNDDRLREFAFLTDWPNFTEEKKQSLLAAHACHEFHLFLARKDKAFFEKHVKPLLAQKLEPEFMDDFLVGRDLKNYLRPFAWSRLNAAEKALLSQALPEAHERISKELSLRWEIEAPSPDLETRLFTQTLRGTDLATEDSLGMARNEVRESEGGLAYLTSKLHQIIIPRIDFEDTTLEEAIDFLRLRSVELDTLELDPQKKGVNFVIRRPRASDENDPGQLRIRELRVRNVPLAVAIQFICDQTMMKQRVDDFAVTLVPLTESGEDFVTRSFSVGENFSEAMGGDRNAPIIELLRGQGITFSDGSSATLRRGLLIVKNTPSELDKIDQLVASLRSNNFSSSLPADDFEGGVIPPLEAPSSPAPISAAPADPFSAAVPASPLAEPEMRRAKKAISPPRLFPKRTRLYREANYFRNTRPSGESLIPLNHFWLDLAAWDGKGLFLSPHFNACHTNANEALMCLALLDLPFAADRPEVTVDGSSLRVKAREPMLLFYKDTRRTDKLAAESPLLVRQTFSPLAEPFRTVNGRQIENPVTGDFKPGIAYRASLVITNPTGIGRRIELLAQIPAGAIPLAGKTATLSTTEELKPYGVVMQSLDFYFPAVGDFAIYPLHVSENGTILAHTDPRTLRVSNASNQPDAASWLALASDGSNEQILSRLKSENLQTIDLSAICWRLQDKEFFTSVTRLLRERLWFSKEISAYGFYHNDLASIREYLENSDFTSQAGDWLDSAPLEIRPRIHRDWQTLEFDPLINARAHRFGEKSRLTHEAARNHYHDFLNQLGWKSALDDNDKLTLTALLFLQDRIDEALVRFDTIDPVKLPGRISYDYLHAIVLFHREQPEDARAIAAAVLPALAPGVWRDRFQAVVDQAREIADLQKPVADPAAGKEPPAPQLDLRLAGNDKIVIRHRSLDQVNLRLFSVDLEMLFSSNPFLRADDQTSADPPIEPNAVLNTKLEAAAGETTIDLPPALRRGNVLVFAKAGSVTLAKVLDSTVLDLRHLPEDRSVQVFDSADSKPLSKTYVKVYAETKSGEISFHKDGYTDLRGKFDYASDTATDLSSIRRFAILVSHPEKGARTIIYDR